MPGKHKNRKKRNRPRRIQIVIRRIAIPAGVGNAESIAELKRHLRSGDPLPEDWQVNIAWRNPNTKVGRSREWQEGDWDSVLEDSAGSTGFAAAVGNALRKASGQEPVKPKPQADKKQLGLFDKPKSQAKKQVKSKAKRPTAKQVFSKRSAAAKKGWATRRAKGAK